MVATTTRLTVIALWLALANAQSSTVVSLLLGEIGGDTRHLAGSIVASDATATTYAFACSTGGGNGNAKSSRSAAAAQNSRRQVTASAPAVTVTATASAPSYGYGYGSGSDNSNGGDFSYGASPYGEGNCDVNNTQTVTQGPSTLHFVASYGGYTNTVDCKLTGTTSAVCAGTVAGEVPGGSGNSTDIQTVTFGPSDIPPFTPVTITAGPVSGSASASASGSGKGNGGGGTKKGSESSTPTATAGSSAGTGTATGSAAAASKTGAAALMREPVLEAVVAGAAAIGLAAALL